MKNKTIAATVSLIVMTIMAAIVWAIIVDRKKEIRVQLCRKRCGIVRTMFIERQCHCLSKKGWMRIKLK